MAYRVLAIQVTLSDLQGKPPNAGLFKCDFFRTVVQELTRFRLR